MTDNILEARGLTVRFRRNKNNLTAVNQVDLGLRRGLVTALVGESGSGKTTLALAMLNMTGNTGQFAGGSIWYEGKNILELKKDALMAYRWKEVSMIFQSAQSALNPLMTVREHYEETYLAHLPKATPDEMLPLFQQLLRHVMLDPDRVLQLYPHELSGGMKQRVMIAFSLLLAPKIIILDEPTTALDVITQDHIFSILADIHAKTDVTMLLLTHDIGVVAKVADRIAVMYAGRIVEEGDIYDVFGNTAHPYSHALIDSAPSLLDTSEDKEPIPGSPPNITELPSGCAFHPRCRYATQRCKEELPALISVNTDHLAACHNIEQFRRETQAHE